MSCHTYSQNHLGCESRVLESSSQKVKVKSSKSNLPVGSRRGIFEKKFSCGDTVEIRFEALSRISTVSPHEKFFPRRDPTGKLNFELFFEKAKMNSRLIASPRSVEVGCVGEWVGVWASSSPAPFNYLDVPHITRELRSGPIS